jgi:two-component system cell cycle sensor histidine kinase/response regulator CckA
VVSKKAVFRLELEPARVEADAAQIHQVIMNLIVNASDSLGEQQGHIIIRTGARQYTPGELSSNLVDDPPPAGPYAYLEVEDEGCGMEPATIARIFDPFYSTKFTGRGLGLSAVLGIVRGHRGTIQVESQVGRGTRFVLLLPHAAAAGPPSVGAAQPLPCQRRGRLLVVDDEELVRASVCVMLEDAGFSALSAADGLEGIELFQRHASEIDAVVLDLTMPRLDGWQCLRRLRELREDIPVLIMSGYAAELSIPDGVTPAPLFLRKPFDAEELIQAAGHLLSTSA